MSPKTLNPVAAAGAKAALVPKLRFPEFRSEDAWQVKPLNKLLFEPKKRNKDLELGPEHVLSVSGEYGCVNQIEFMGRSYAGVSVKDYHVVEHGDVVYTKSPLKKNPFGIIKVNKGQRGIVSTLYAIYRPFPDCSGTYLDHFFSGDYNLNAYLQPLVKKGAKNDMKVNNTDVLKGNICVPKLPEQQKIADCLSSLDELIAAQAREVDVLKTHKKGLMQQLFPREGETQPRLRFPEFQDAGQWSGAPMGALLVSSPDYGVNAAAVPFSESLPRYLRITDISEDGLYLPEKQVSVDLNVTDGNYLDKGDIVLARTGASVGKSYQYRQEDGRLVFAGFLIRIRPHPKKLVSTYLANFLTTGQFWKWVSVTSARSGQPGINGTEYSSLPIPLPPTLPEQQRIADCLRSLDALIAAATQELNTLKTHKQGLMQQLFPSAEALEA